MADTLLGAAPAHTSGELPIVGSVAPAYTLVGVDLGSVRSRDLAGTRVVLNIFPSVGTGVCAAAVRQFNVRAASLADTVVVCVSRDLPFAQQAFCVAEGIEGVTMASDFRDHAFGRAYGVDLLSSAFAGLLARAVVVVDRDGTVLHAQLVPQIGDEPDYDAALAVL